MEPYPNAGRGKAVPKDHQANVQPGQAPAPGYRHSSDDRCKWQHDERPEGDDEPQALQRLVIQNVVVDQAGEAVLATVPNVPDERAVVEPPAMLLEEAVAEPVVERRPRPAAGIG